MANHPERDFDFIYGRWRVHNRRLRDNTDPNCAEWVDFEGTCEAFPILDGSGHIDQITVTHPPEGSPWVGMTLRLYDPAEKTWRIWWSSTRAPGRLDPSMSGGFDGGHGVFFGADVVNDRPIRLRFDWYADGTSPRWEQRFSFDDGQTWIHNWTMSLTRTT
jgi:hypothetical protein